MRNLHVVALFTILLIAHATCKPGLEYNDYHNDGPDDGFDYGGEGDQENDLDGDTSSSKTAPPPVLHTRPLKLLARLGDVVRLPCNVTNIGNYAVNWYRGKEQLYAEFVPLTSDRDRIKWETGNTLVIHRFNESDVSDDYRCEVTTEIPLIVSHSVRTSKHVFVLPRELVPIKEHMDVILECEGNWEPKPKFGWFHAGHPVKTDAVAKDGSSLTIRNATTNDAGLYQCLTEVKDETEKKIMTPIFVIVGRYAPKVKIESTEVHAGLGMESEIKCLVDAYPQAIVTWYFEGSQIFAPKVTVQRINPVQSNHALVIDHTEESHFGKYTCKVANDLGRTEGTVLLTGAPSVPKFVSGIMSDDNITPVTIWKVESFLPIKKVTLKYRLVGDKEWKLEYPAVSDDSVVNSFTIKHPIKGLKPGTYQTMLIAENKYGSSESTIYEMKGECVTAEPATVHKQVDNPHVASRDHTTGGLSTSDGPRLTVWRSLLLTATLLACMTHL